jgi:5-methylthioribose kinase
MAAELTAENAVEWLIRHGLPATNMHFSELGGGISNKVVLAEGPGLRAVLKQSLGRLRSNVDWNSDRSRIFREAAALRWFHSERTVPRLLFEDRPTFTMAMEAAPSGAEMWKTQLFRGQFDSRIAIDAGLTLGRMISVSWQNPEAERLFGDQTIFDQLRLEPYYRFTASRCGEAAGYIAKLLAKTAARHVSLVHGDWSPKNLLVGENQLWAIDWEVIHYGDPSFDAGFLLNHLLMKSITMPQHRIGISVLARNFLDALSSAIPAGGEWILNAAFEHLPALLLARVRGKSPAEYFDGPMRQRAKVLALDLMSKPANSVEELFSR